MPVAKRPGSADPAERAPATWIERNRVRGAPIRRRSKVSAAGAPVTGELIFRFIRVLRGSKSGGRAARLLVAIRSGLQEASVVNGRHMLNGRTACRTFF